MPMPEALREAERRLRRFGLNEPAAGALARLEGRVGRAKSDPDDDGEVVVAVDTVLVDYNLTADDEEWLRRHPKYGENGDPRFKLSNDTFERMLDILEKATAWGVPVSLSDAEALFVDKLRLHRSSGNKVG